jgi:F-type H+-transporting ATPase subunit b
LKRYSGLSILLSALALCFLSLPVSARASSPPAAPDGRASTLSSKAVLAFWAVPPEGESEEKESGSETSELIFKTINFIILIGGLGYLLRKPLAEFFVQRSGAIRAQLDEGRKALEASQARMTAIEEKLLHLEEEIAAFKASATRESEVERQNLRAAAAQEAEKILESARARMETSTRAAKLELRYFVAEEALKQAETLIQGRLDEATRNQLVSQFMARLDVSESRN